MFRKTTQEKVMQMWGISGRNDYFLKTIARFAQLLYGAETYMMLQEI